MRSVLRIKELDETTVVNYADGFRINGLMEEQTSQRTHQTFTECLNVVQLRGIRIAHRDSHLAEEITIQVEHDFPFLKMHFELKGCSSYVRMNQGSNDALISHGTHQLMYFPEVKGTLTYPPGHRYTLEVLMTLDYLGKILNDDFSVLSNFGIKVSQNQPIKLGHNSRPITPAMAHVILEIIHCPLVGLSKKIFLEAKIMELFCLQLECFRVEVCPLKEICKKEDVDKLHFVKEYLEQHTEENLSLHQLARESGLNSFKLKKGFKEHFGNTVFGYWTDVKLQKAKHMIVEEGLSISDVAQKIGYKNPQHFTAAFKRQFGYLPSLLKR